MDWVKIVLLSIAIILGLILFILIYNYVVTPFLYELEIKGKGKVDTLEARLQVRSPLRFLMVNAGYENKSIFYNGSIFWGKLTLFSSDADNKKRKKDKNNTGSDKDTDSGSSDNSLDSDGSGRNQQGASETRSDNRGPEVHSDTPFEKEGTGSGAGGRDVEAELPVNGFEDDVFEDEVFKDFNPMKAKITEETPQKKSIFRTIKNIKDANLNYSLIIKNAKRLLYALRVKHFEADCDYSLGAPDTTGKAIGIMSMFPFMYGKAVDMRPDFMSEDVLLNGRVALKGSFRLAFLVHPALIIFIEIWRKTK